jgi:hypothetical protein
MTAAKEHLIKAAVATPCFAKHTFTAGKYGRNQNFLPKPFRIARNDGATYFMAQCQRRFGDGRYAVKEKAEIGVADAATGDLYQNISRPKFGYWNLGQLKLTRNFLSRFLVLLSMVLPFATFDRFRYVSH